VLSLRKGTTLTKEMFLNHLYGGMDEPELKIIDVFTCKLRRSSPTPRTARTTSKPPRFHDPVEQPGVCCARNAQQFGRAKSGSAFDWV
jgi:hypothetical protein